MKVREATHDDADGIRRVADASLEATYAGQLGEDIVAAAADEWYGTDRLADRLDVADVVFLVVVVDDRVVAFSESELDVRQPTGEDSLESASGVAAIQWLHVHPDHRDEGLGGRLLERTESDLFERGANRVEGRVLAANRAGNEFYRASGYGRTGKRTLDIAGETYTEHLYVNLSEGEAAELTEEHEVDGDTVFVAYDERERGSAGPFHAAYNTADREDRYGFYCANCGSLDTTMDAMGRVECGDCGNERKATRWDSAYL
ncbi:MULTISPECIES: GNAT family N-acetyltransferase [Halobacterium]|uniref:GNAT family N-acetyltransferase n=1 Tax=Halobacterium TaxID=2239 RepID=UPI00073FA59F|nr:MULTISPECIES: GNAT family N-acetyltransferase [Halobacterium]MCG1002418.1 GNAT family N-acetyltransferase [Halobacterium noricense]